MPYQNIDATISPADMLDVKSAFRNIADKLPLLVSLTTQERRTVVKAGPDSLSFVENALTAARANPGILPASFDIAGFDRDVKLFAALTELQTLAASLASMLDDTRLAVGSEAMQGASQVYNYVKAGAKTCWTSAPVAWVTPQLINNSAIIVSLSGFISFQF